LNKLNYKKTTISQDIQIEVSNAYWISPVGKIFSVHGLHINEVFNNPPAFGLTDKELKLVYKKYNEPLEIEGKARNEIIKNLIIKGWVRIRYNVKNDYYSVELDKLNKRKRDYLYWWAKAIQSGNKKYNFSGVRIVEFMRDYNLLDISICDIVEMKLMKTNEKQIKYFLTPLNSVFEILEIHRSIRDKMINPDKNNNIRSA